MSKTISVIIPTYNRVDLTNRAIESVKSDNPDIIEIVVVDDCSTRLYFYSEGKNLSGIDVRVIRCERNGGAGRARALGVDHAKGRLIAFLDSDDEFGPLWMDSVLRELSDTKKLQGKNALMFIGQVKGGGSFYQFLLKLTSRAPNFFRATFVRLLFVFFNPFYTPSIALSRDICRFHPSLRFCEDYYTNALGSFHAEYIVPIDQLACRLGRAPNSGGGLSNARTKMLAGELAVRLNLLRSAHVPIGFKPLVVLGVMYQFARSILQAGVILSRGIGKSTKGART